MCKGRHISFKKLNKIRSPIKPLHLNIAGPFPNNSIREHKYFLPVIDDCSRKATLFPMKMKDENLNSFYKLPNKKRKVHWPKDYKHNEQIIVPSFVILSFTIIKKNRA